MYHQKITEFEAVALDPKGSNIEQVAEKADLLARMTALMIIAALPLLLVWFLVRFVWSDVKAIGRALRVALGVYTEEFSRKP